GWSAGLPRRIPRRGLIGSGGRGGHQQQQASALRIEQPGFRPEGLPPRRLQACRTQVQGDGDPGVQHRGGSRLRGLRLRGLCSRARSRWRGGRPLQAQRQPPRLARLGPAAGGGVELEPAAGGPGNAPVASAQPRLGIHRQLGA
ncbi:MAG: hypothetical protein ACK55I_12385, partial [bacterium]